MRRLLLLFLMASCGDRALFLERPWGADRTVVVVATDTDGAPLAPPAIGGGATVRFDLVADPPFSLFAQVFAPEVLAPDCPIGFEGAGSLLPDEREVFSVLVRDFSAAAAFAPAESPGIAVKTTCTVPLPCPRMSIESTRIDELDAGLTAILPLSSTRVLLGGERTPSIVEVDGSERRVIDSGALGGGIRSLAWDGAAVIGSTFQSAFRLELDTATYQLEEAPPPVRGLELVPGGPPVLYGDFGVREVLGASSATTAIERISVRVRHVRVAPNGQAILIDEGNVVYGFNGIFWRIENPSTGGLTTESFRRVAGDESSFMLVGKRENVFLRRGEAWQQLPVAFNRGVDFTDAVALGGGRFFVVGEFGTGALYQDGWCTYDLGFEGSVSRVARAPDGETFFAGTEADADGHPRLLRFTFE